MVQKVKIAVKLKEGIVKEYEEGCWVLEMC